MLDVFSQASFSFSQHSAGVFSAFQINRSVLLVFWCFSPRLLFSGTFTGVRNTLNWMSSSLIFSILSENYTLMKAFDKTICACAYKVKAPIKKMTT